MCVKPWNRRGAATRIHQLTLWLIPLLFTFNMSHNNPPPMFEPVKRKGTWQPNGEANMVKWSRPRNSVSCGKIRRSDNIFGVRGSVWGQDYFHSSEHTDNSSWVSMCVLANRLWFKGIVNWKYTYCLLTTKSVERKVKFFNPQTTKEVVAINRVVGHFFKSQQTNKHPQNSNL